MTNIISAAVEKKAQAIHPGFGLLSENSTFAAMCQECNINYQTNFKLIEQYNSVLEENKILYVYRHTRMIRDENGQVKNLNNHYGRYEMKDNIVTFALNYEEYLGIYDRNDTVHSAFFLLK